MAPTLAGSSPAFPAKLISFQRRVEVKARKVTLTVKVEVLDIDSAYTLLMEVLSNIRENECENGMLQKDDGDRVEWKTTRKNVEF